MMKFCFSWLCLVIFLFGIPFSHQDCDRPTNLQDNVVITPDQSSYGTYYSYVPSCEPGYDVSGPITFYCTENYTPGPDYWDPNPSLTVCFAKCNAPSHTNGTGIYEYGEEVTFVCDPGYELPRASSITTTCNDGNWSPTVRCTSEKGSEVICNSTTLTIILDRELVGANTPAGDVHLDDETCVAYDYDEKYLALSTTYDACLTTYKTTNNTITYLNTVTYREYQGTSGGLISRDKTMHIPVSCELERTQVLHSAFVADVEEVQRSEKGFGNYSLTLDRYTDQFFNESVVDPADEVALGDPLFFAVHLESVSGFIVFVKSCWATPSTNSNDAKSYIFLDNGCTEDKTMVLMSPFNSSTQTFRIDAFSFIEENPEVYIHCGALVCDNDPSSRCAKGCLPRRKRRGQQSRGQRSTSSDRILSVGPIYSSRGRNAVDPLISVSFKESVGNHGNSETIGKSSTRTNYLHTALIGGFVGISCLLLGMGAIFLLMSRRHHGVRSGYRYEEVVNDDEDVN